MVDKKLLKELGWSKELIGEVTRLGNDINTISEKISVVKDSVSVIETVSSNSCYYVSGDIDTASYIDFESKKKD